MFSSFVIELTTEFLSHVMQSFCKFPVLGSERLQLSGEIPQFFLLLQNAVLLSVGELVELKKHKPQSCQANQQHQTESQQDQGHWTPSRRGTLVLCGEQKQRQGFTFSSSWIYISSKEVRGVRSNRFQGLVTIPLVLGNSNKAPGQA